MTWGVLPLLVGCAEPLPVPSVAPAQDPSGEYFALLGEVASPRGVDWEALRARRETLERYLGWVAEHGPLTDDMKESRETQRLAFLLNGHNAWVLYAVLQRGTPARLDPPGLPWGRDLFSGTAVRFDNEWITLSLLQSERLLARFQDPLVHVGIYRANRTSPPLRAWPSNGLWAALEGGAASWLWSDRGMRETADGFAINERLVAFQDDFTYWGRAESLCSWLVSRASAAPKAWLEAHPQDCTRWTFPEDLALDRVSEPIE